MHVWALIKLKGGQHTELCRAAEQQPPKCARSQPPISDKYIWWSLKTCTRQTSSSTEKVNWQRGLSTVRVRRNVQCYHCSSEDPMAAALSVECSRKAGLTAVVGAVDTALVPPVVFVVFQTGTIRLHYHFYRLPSMTMLATM